MIPVFAAVALLPGQVGKNADAFEAKAKRLMSTYRMFIAPVDMRAGTVSTDPVNKEKRRRVRVMWQAAEKFDPRGFDRYSGGLTGLYRMDFLGGIRLRAKGARLNDPAMQSKGTVMMVDFVNNLRTRAPQTLPKNFDTQDPIPAVWKPGTPPQKG